MTTQLPKEQQAPSEVPEKKSWWRRWWMMAVYVLVGVLVLGAVALVVIPQSSDPAESYVGTWITTGGVYTEFRDDGTYITARSQLALEQSNLIEWGTFTFDGDVLRLTTSEDSVFCAGIDAVYEAEPSEDGNFIGHTRVADRCSPRAADFSWGISRVEPLGD